MCLSLFISERKRCDNKQTSNKRDLILVLSQIVKKQPPAQQNRHETKQTRVSHNTTSLIITKLMLSSHLQPPSAQPACDLIARQNTLPPLQAAAASSINKTVLNNTTTIDEKLMSLIK
jgi:hypothetical protein